MEPVTSTLVGKLMNLPLFDTVWVLYALGALSTVALAVTLERTWFLARRRVDVNTVRRSLDERLAKGRFQDAVDLLAARDSFETNVVLFGLTGAAGGADAVEDLLAGALQRERHRYERGLSVLATIASIAPFVGLFGTVLGIIHAFHQLAVDLAHASTSVMAGISEALVTTAIGLLVAVPTLAVYNALKTGIKGRAVNAHLLSRVLQARLKATPAPAGVPHGV
jgi:biopolymer transport protein ExbB